MLLWHYTHGANIIALVKSGVILSDVENVLPEDEKGPVWFSKNQEWEQTVKKTAIWKPDFPLMTFTELVKELGAYRIGVKPSTAPISAQAQRVLRNSAKNMAETHGIGSYRWSQFHGRNGWRFRSARTFGGSDTMVRHPSSPRKLSWL